MMTPDNVAAGRTSPTDNQSKAIEPRDEDDEANHNSRNTKYLPPPPRTRSHKNLTGKGLSGRTHNRVAPSRQAPSSKDVTLTSNSSRPLPSSNSFATAADPTGQASPPTIAPDIPVISSTASSHSRHPSESKLPRRGGSTANTANNTEPNTRITSHTNPKPPSKPQADVRRRVKSLEKPRRTWSSTTLLKPHLTVPEEKRAPSKTQVHFDLGEEEPEDEWVDASASASPQLSQKPSISSDYNSGVDVDTVVASGGGASQVSGRPGIGVVESSASIGKPSRDEKRVHHQEYLTSRLLQRTPSTSTRHLSTQMASAALTDGSPSIPTDSSALLLTPATGTADSHKDGVTSRFLVGPSSGLSDSFRNPLATSGRQDNVAPRRRRSIGAPEQHQSHLNHSEDEESDDRTSGLKHHRGSTSRALEHYRTQQKLELQRASSVIEPNQSMGVTAAIVAANPLVASQGDPRMGRLLDRVDMEYWLVRRFQHPVARSILRLDQMNFSERHQRIRRTNTGPTGGSETGHATSNEDGGGDLRRSSNASAPNLEAIRSQRSNRHRRPSSVQVAPVSGEVGGENTPLAEVFSRGSGGEIGEARLDNEGIDEDGISAMLQALWERPTQIAAT